MEGAALPGWAHAWRRLDRFLVRGTEVVLVGIGGTFTVLVSLEVLARYVFDFSIFAINALARFLLVWFFLLGAGPALREGAHVGLELVVRALPGRSRRLAGAAAQLIVLVFFLEMTWSGLASLGPALTRTEPALGISLFWVMLAFPTGFVLLIYHQFSLLLEELLGLPRQRLAT